MPYNPNPPSMGILLAGLNPQEEQAARYSHLANVLWVLQTPLPPTDRRIYTPEQLYNSLRRSQVLPAVNKPITERHYARIVRWAHQVLGVAPNWDFGRLEPILYGDSPSLTELEQQMALGVVA